MKEVNLLASNSHSQNLKNEIEHLKQELVSLQKDELHEDSFDMSHHIHRHHLPTNVCDGFFIKGDCKIPVNVPPFCDNRVRLWLGGLTGNLNFLLFRQKGCKVKINFDCNGKNETVKGVICQVGTDFLDILQKDKTVVTILQDRINRIRWKDKDCNPCHCGCDECCCEDL